MLAFLSTLLSHDKKADKSEDPYDSLNKKLSKSGISNFTFAHCGTVSVDSIELAQSHAYKNYISLAKKIVESN